jgi:hypothetical protein
MRRLKHIHPVLILGISLLIPALMTYSLCLDLSRDVLVSSDMSFEDFGDEDLSTCEREFKVFVPTVSSNPLLPWIHFAGRLGLFSSPLTSYSQMTPVLRC